MIPVHFSPCPNDTFVLAAMMQKLIPLRREWLIELHDIETLNELACLSDKNICSPGIYKTSTGSLREIGNHWVLPCGMAYTEKAGPIFAARQEAFSKDRSTWKILSPGKGTTACALAEILLNLKFQLHHVRYDEIIPLLKKGDADAGLLIHEARFTYEEHGLRLVEDLGKLWTEEEKSPLILAVLVAHQKLGIDIIKDFIIDYQNSLSWAWKHPLEASKFATTYAQEKSHEIVQAHISHFVSKRSFLADSSCFESLKTLGSHAPAFHFCHTT